jgi:2,6-dihydroxypseudooxynicotine hydrolase
MDDRVAAAIANWAPRFTTNGVTAGDFERITSGLASWDDWCAA